MEYRLIANTGIHMTTFPLEINSQEKYKMWFHEWYDTSNGQWKLDLVHEYSTEDGLAYFKKTCHTLTSSTYWKITSDNIFRVNSKNNL